MKVLGIITSSRKNGYTARMVNALLSEAEKQGHETEIISLYDLDFKSCGNCGPQKKLPPKQYCALQDDLTPVMQKLIEADCLILSSPIYMDDISGTAKTFLDRWCIFVNPDMTVQFTPGKKYIQVLASGAAAKYYSGIPKRQDGTLSGFFKMEKVGLLFFGGTMDPDVEEKFVKYLKKAKGIIKKL